MKMHKAVVLAILLFGVAAHLVASNRVVRRAGPLPLDKLGSIAMKSAGNSHYLPDRIIVKLRQPIALSKTSQSFGVASLDNLARKFGVRSVERVFQDPPPNAKNKIDFSRFYVMRYTSPVEVFKAAREIAALSEVEYAEPWFIYPVQGIAACTPSDTMRWRQWYLDKILADSAFCVAQGDTSIVIGIIDTGVQLDHPDLQANIWHNPNEMGSDGHGGLKQTNGLDNDANGFVGDWQGWDFGGADYNNPVGDNDPSPKSAGSGHGTHVAGTAAAVTDNIAGIAGIGYHCRILAVKTSSDNDTRSQGNPYIVFGFQGIAYASQMGAKIINCSWGGPGASQFEQDVIDSVTAHGSLVVAAAGNDHSYEPNYPSSYIGVLSVAATSKGDQVTAYTNLGETVDLSAPGGTGTTDYRTDIWGTDYPSTYGTEAGTSFSSPLAAGVAGLVAAKFPWMNPLQIGEQVRVTADDINAQNQTYQQYLMGRGRVNAYRALTASTPSLRMLSFTVLDSLGNDSRGVLKLGQNYSVVATFLNYLQPLSSSAVVTLSSSDPNIQVLSGTYSIGSLDMMGTATNTATPFQIHVSNNAAPAAQVRLLLTMDDAGYHDFQVFRVTVNPTFATHDDNNILATFTNRGRIGFTDLSQSQGVGFVFPAKGGVNQLFEGGLMMGTSASKLVDVVRNPDAADTQDSDFVSNQLYTISAPGVIASQEGYTYFTDSTAPSVNRVGLQVNMTSYAFTTPADSNYIIVRYDIKNNSGADISNFYAGLFFDWDMQPDYSTNRTAYDAAHQTGYAWDAGSPGSIYCGTRILEGNPGYYGIINNLSVDLSRAGKWSWLSSGIVTVDSIQDIHYVVSSGPYTIANGATQRIGFALIGGYDLANLLASSDAAQAKWAYIKSILGVSQPARPLPKEFSLSQNYPNPFNPGTHIEISCPTSGYGTLTVYNLLGEVVNVLLRREIQAGVTATDWNGKDLQGKDVPSGIYFYRLSVLDARSGNRLFGETRKMILMR